MHNVNKIIQSFGFCVLICDVCQTLWRVRSPHSMLHIHTHQQLHKKRRDNYRTFLAAWVLISAPVAMLENGTSTEYLMECSSCTTTLLTFLKLSLRRAAAPSADRTCSVLNNRGQQQTQISVRRSTDTLLSTTTVCDDAFLYKLYSSSL